METKKQEVLVADDHSVVRQGIVHILNATPDLMVVGEASTGPEVMTLVQERDWDAVILDLRMPGLHGLDLLKQLRVIKPQLPVLVLSMEPEGIYARRLLRAGAAGYLTKDCIEEDLVNAVRKVCAGGRYISQGLVEQITFNIDLDVERPPHEQLSDRELEVMRLLAIGKMPSIIAKELCISVKTVSTYRARILYKMSMNTNAEIVKYGVTQGLVE